MGSDTNKNKNEVSLDVELASAKKTISSLKATCTIRQKKISELEREIERDQKKISDLIRERNGLSDIIEIKEAEIAQLKRNSLSYKIRNFFHL